MPEQNQQLLFSLMKKQIKEDAKSNKVKKEAAKSKNLQNEASKADAKTVGEGEKDVKEMTEEEVLEDAKKGSKNKAAQYDQTEMIKKLIMENIVKYVVIISVLVVLAIGAIEIGPAFFHMLNGLLSKVLFGALSGK